LLEGGSFMIQLEKILGTTKFRSLTESEKTQIKELIVANPIYEYLIAGIVGSHEWKNALSDAHSKYVRPAQIEKTVKSEKTNSQLRKTAIFETADFEVGTKTGIIL
jgi:hypothetical protein